MGKKKKKVIPKPDYREYINSAAWRKKKWQTYWCLGKVCEVCGSNKKIHVHHNNYSSLGSERIFRDLVILCYGCHAAFHKIVPSRELGNDRVGYLKKCSLCMRNEHKQTKYLSCSTSRRIKEQKERKHRTLRICEVCIGSLKGCLLSENKISNINQKEQRIQAAQRKEAKRMKRLLCLEAQKEKAKLLPPKAPKPKKAKLLPPKAPKSKKAKKPKKAPPPLGPPEVLIRRKSSI